MTDREPVMENSKRKDGMIRRARVGLMPVTLLASLIVWEAISRWGDLAPFLLPSPGAVARRLWLLIEDGSLARHAGATLLEVLSGLAMGLIVAFGLGYLLAKSHVAERLLSPYIVATQSIPVVAIAPLLVIWFGPGPFSKILVAALIVFFPVLVNTILGLRSVPIDLRDLMRSLRASRWQVFVKLELPASSPVLLGGLKIGATLAVIGAVVGEFVGSDQGLGFLVNLGRGLYDTPLVFAAILVLICMAMALYGSVALMEHWLLGWREPPRRG